MKKLDFLINCRLHESAETAASDSHGLSDEHTLQQVIGTPVPYTVLIMSIDHFCISRGASAYDNINITIHASPRVICLV